MDNVYTPDLIMEQYDYHGTLINGFINSVLGQRDVTVTTQGYNYIALNDDVQLHRRHLRQRRPVPEPGLPAAPTSAPKETRSGQRPRRHRAGRRSLRGRRGPGSGVHRHLPILLNIANEPTDSISKDAANLVKSYAMVKCGPV